MHLENIDSTNTFPHERLDIEKRVSWKHMEGSWETRRSQQVSKINVLAPKKKYILEAYFGELFKIN